MCVFTNSQRPVVECLTAAASILARSQGVFKGTGADKRFVKTLIKSACCHRFYKYLFLSYFVSLTKHYFKRSAIALINSSLFTAFTFSRVVISAKSFVIVPLSIVSNVAFQVYQQMPLILHCHLILHVFLTLLSMRRLLRQSL